MTSYSCCGGFDQQPLLNHYDVGKRRMSVHLTACNGCICHRGMREKQFLWLKEDIGVR